LVIQSGKIAFIQYNKNIYMPYLIDGHNLIPKIPGLRLDQLDDEQSLFALLDDYFKQIRKKLSFTSIEPRIPTMPIFILRSCTLILSIRQAQLMMPYLSN